MQEMGMNIENCELWLSRAALAIAAAMLTLIVIRVRPHQSEMIDSFLIRSYTAPFFACCFNLLHGACALMP